MRATLVFAIVGILSSGCRTTNQSFTPTDRNLLPKAQNPEVREWIGEISEEVESQTIESEIPLEMNEKVEFWLNYFANRDKDRFQRFLNRGDRYRAMVEAKLSENEVPKELYYLAMIESGFATHARSHAQAVGIWQFIRGTGKRYNLKIASGVDERRDPQRATVAAARYLSDLHNVFQSWYLAMAAYNAGEARIMNAIMKANTRDFWELVAQKALPRETMNYVPKFIAASIIGHHPDRFGFEVTNTEKWPDLSAVAVPTRRRLSDIARVTGTPLDVLKEYNPHLRQGVTPNQRSDYELWVPRDYVSNFEKSRSMLASLSPYKIAPSYGSKYYRVRRGDTLGKIAARHRMSLGQLKRMNNLRSNRIYPGKKLLVKGSRKSNRSPKSGVVVHRVRKGDTLGKISKKYSTTIAKLKSSNNLRSNTIRVGQRLKVNGSTTSKNYKVKRGDNLYSIARRFKIPLTRLKRKNGLKRNKIFVGQVLRI